MSLITAPHVEGMITVRNDRKLGFAEFGPINGRPIFWFHGTPGARRQIPQAARVAAAQNNLRIIGIDRPGIGFSTPFLYDSILDFTTDLKIVIDRMGIEKFAVIGLSGGGPYALATAHAFPDKVTVAGILGGVAPTRGDDAVGGGLVALATRLRSVIPPLRGTLGAALSFVVRVSSPIASPGFDMYAKYSPEGDRRVFERPEIKEMFLDDLVGNSKNGIRAPISDIILFTRDWGFTVRDLKVPVCWWHGDADNIVPLTQAEKFVPMIPKVELIIRPGESHLGGLGAADEVIAKLLSVWN